MYRLACDRATETDCKTETADEEIALPEAMGNRLREWMQGPRDYVHEKGRVRIDRAQDVQREFPDEIEATAEHEPPTVGRIDTSSLYENKHDEGNDSRKGDIEPVACGSDY